MKTAFEHILLESALQLNIRTVTQEQLTGYIQSSNIGAYTKVLNILKESKEDSNYKIKLEDVAFEAHWEQLLKQ